MVRTGLDTLVAESFERLHGKAVAVLCNQASIDRNLDHILDLLLPLHRSGKLAIRAVFGPQHGLFGHTQDNMIEWEGQSDPVTGWRVHSLYGENREPTAEMLEGVEVLLVDLQDVGARYYTFVWTMALCIRACSRKGIPVLVLDRPNPIGGDQIEGALLDPKFSSFVGLYPLPMRHGLTIGEIAAIVAADIDGAALEVLPMDGWRRSMYFDETGLPWVMPSPNMPLLDTAILYPGACLVEGTNLSEGRGTTRPFETIGAPYLQGRRFCEALNCLRLGGVKFRPIEFEPTFNKHAGVICGGCFIHVLDRRAFEPVLTFVAILQEAIRQGRQAFAWKEPPYEYEWEKRPIDILAGNGWLAEAIEELEPLSDIKSRFDAELRSFAGERDRVLLYR